MAESEKSNGDAHADLTEPVDGVSDRLCEVFGMMYAACSCVVQSSGAPVTRTWSGISAPRLGMV
jgi:hypothetical protein